MRQQEQVRRSRRIGLGITGLADALAMLGQCYDSEPARRIAAHVMQTIRDAAYETSVELARGKGPCPAFEAEAYLERPFIRELPAEIRSGMRLHGIRNSHLIAIAPAGTISLLAHNVSSGIEPIFGLEALRRVREPDGTWRNFQTTDYAYALWRARQQSAVDLPPCFVDGLNIAPREHLAMQAALQPYVDGAISKTIALPKDFAMSGVPEIFASAYRLGLKGCTIYRAETRAGVVTGSHAIDRVVNEMAREAICCGPERESD